MAARSDRPKKSIPLKTCLAAFLCIMGGLLVYLELHLVAHISNENSAAPNHPPTLPHRRRIPSHHTPDGRFNGAPLFLQTTLKSTRVRCVGNNFQTDAWKQRSCYFDFVCFNASANNFVVFDDNHNNNSISSDALHNQTVSIGGINQKWGGVGIPRMEWFPQIVPQPKEIKYYRLPEQVVWLPLHSLNSENPGHLVWDDFLPAFTLLDMFGLVDHHPLMLRYVLHDEHPRGLWGACDLRSTKTAACNVMMKKFYELMFGLNSPWNYTSSTNYTLTRSDTSVDLICAKGVAGVGALTDHGIQKSHGWEKSDIELTHNHGRGGLLYAFRNYMMQNMGAANSGIDRTAPPKVVFSLSSSRRHISFEHEIELIIRQIPRVQVVAAVLHTMSLQEQLQLADSASIFVTLCGGGAVTAMFASRGSSVLVYYSESDGLRNNRHTNEPARLDWDFLNAMSYARVHWLSSDTKGEAADNKAFVSLVKHELDLIESDAFSIR